MPEPVMKFGDYYVKIQWCFRKFPSEKGTS